MRERNFYTPFRDWMNNNIDMVNREIGHCLAIEIKLVKSDSIDKIMSFPFDMVTWDEIDYLKKATQEKGLAYKIPDMPHIPKQCLYQKKCPFRFTSKKPFDLFYVSKARAFIVVIFWVSRKKKIMYWIDLNKFLELKDYYYQTLERKSIRENQLKHLSNFTFDLKGVKK
jgi:hypothetical protein